jgi:hypothetical protein
MCAQGWHGNDPCLKARIIAAPKVTIIAAVKNIDASILTRVCGKKLNIVSMCAVSSVVHTSNISSCQKNIFSFPVSVNNSIKVCPLVFLIINFCNPDVHYETPRMKFL